MDLPDVPSRSDQGFEAKACRQHKIRHVRYEYIFPNILNHVYSKLRSCLSMTVVAVPRSRLESFIFVSFEAEAIIMQPARSRHPPLQHQSPQRPFCSSTVSRRCVPTPCIVPSLETRQCPCPTETADVLQPTPVGKLPAEVLSHKWHDDHGQKEAELLKATLPLGLGVLVRLGVVEDAARDGRERVDLVLLGRGDVVDDE